MAIIPKQHKSASTRLIKKKSLIHHHRYQPGYDVLIISL